MIADDLSSLRSAARDGVMGDIFDERLLTTEELATLLGVSAQMLKLDRGAGAGVPFIRLGRNVRYRRSDVEAYLSANTIRPAAKDIGA